MRVLGFPDPVNERAARLVAAGVVVMTTATLLTGWWWLLLPLTYGFWARVLTGPTLSPLGRLATAVAPRLGDPKPVPGPPKRFAQAIGVCFSSAALVLTLLGASAAADVVLGLLVAAAFLESAVGLCLGCRVFAVLIRLRVVPPTVCERCVDRTVCDDARSAAMRA